MLPLPKANMRFLLSTPPRRIAPLSRTRTTHRKRAVVDKATTSLTPHFQNHPPDPHSASTTSTRRYGQQCGVNCGCVARLELDVVVSNAGQATVRSAQYTAKQILLRQQHLNNNNAPIPWTTTKGRLQFITSPCPTLHTLLEQTIQFVPGKTLRQLQAYTDFSGHRSSEAFGWAVLQQHQLLGTSSSSLSQRPHNCFDLVEDVVTAAVRGYLPSPRTTSRNSWSPQQQHRRRFEPTDDDDDDASGDHLLPQVPLQDHYTSRDHSHWSKSFVMWPFASSEHHHESGGSNDRKSANRWTALDWMDYHWELMEQQQQQDQSTSNREPPEEAAAMASQRRAADEADHPVIKDWVSYVDLRDQNDQSA